MTTVKEMTIGSQVRFTICDVSKEAVMKAVDDYKKSYPYAGYMTHFDEVDYDPTHGYCIGGSRLASCD